MDAAQLERDQESFVSRGVHSIGLPALFYGSLRAPVIFEIVIGRPLETCESEPVVLSGHALAKVIAGDGFPGVFEDTPDAEVPCLLVHDLTDTEQRRVAWYEWDEYKLARFVLADGRAAQAFNPDVDAIRRLHGAIDYHPWSFEEWEKSFLKEAIPGAREWMSHMPVVAEAA